jgi:hypothetical protein
MHLGDDVRGADAAVWRRASFGPMGHHFAATPPLLAVEVSGRDEREPALRAKAQWYSMPARPSCGSCWSTSAA